MAVDQDALDLFQPQIDALLIRVEQLEARPTGGTRLADEAMLDLNEGLSTRLNATENDAERANIIQVLINALP